MSHPQPHPHKKHTPVLAACISILAGLMGAVTATQAGAATATAPGVTSSTVNVGLITDETSGLSADSIGYRIGILAAIAAQNAEGGVDGRKIALDTINDAGSPVNNLTAAKSLLSKPVFAILNASGGGTSIPTAQLTHQDGVPVLGADNQPPFATQPYTNYFGSWGSANPTNPPVTTFGQFYKREGVTKLAVYSYQGIQVADQAAEDYAASAKAAGIKVVYENYDLSLGAPNYTALALGIKDSGANGVAGAVGESVIVSTQEALNAANVHIKAFYQAGDDWSLLQQPESKAAMQGVYISTTYTPPELETAGTKLETERVKKYENYKYPPTFDISTGYQIGEELITGLQQAGKSPTRSSFIKNLRAVKGFTAAGIEVTPVSFGSGPDAFGVGPNSGAGSGECNYFIQVEGAKFVLATQKPICGKVISR